MNELDKRILAGRIKDLRIHLELTQAQFAERVKIPFAQICNYAIAIRRPSYFDTQKLYKLAMDIGQYGLAHYFEERMAGMESAGYREEDAK